MYYPRQGSGPAIVGIGFVADQNRDGLWDASFWDTTGDGEIDMVGSHPDGDLMPSGYTPAS